MQVAEAAVVTAHGAPSAGLVDELLLELAMSPRHGLADAAPAAIADRPAVDERVVPLLAVDRADAELRGLVRLLRSTSFRVRAH
jgi:hypothetical protein